MSNPLIDVLLLTALPASGKSEVRTYLDSLPPEQLRDELHLGPTVQLDDYPYVHLMRRISQELRARGEDGVFFDADDQPLKDPRDWGTLVELLNDDFDSLLMCRPPDEDAGMDWLFERFDAARARVGAAPVLTTMPAGLHLSLIPTLEVECQTLANNLRRGIPNDLEGKTVIIEFARGGPEGATLPLLPPLGYQYALSRLSPAITFRASMLYIWVTPEESRRKNRERSKPGPDGDASILFHGVPEVVMRNDYGCDDIGYLLATSGVPNAVRINTRHGEMVIPVGRFDNRKDLTSFLRGDPETWPAEQVADVHAELVRALTSIASR